ncbi:MAG TPA: hypothetical protein VLL75_19805 [Vicinamibacteria bacterium]|nr:hypothetical protein [Vicinamibacteria bacterium]
MSTDRSDDDVLRRYLLGRLAPDSRESVEKRLFSDDRIFWERLCLLEDELVDQYARGELDGEETASFERDFLCTDERRAKLDLAVALKEYVERRAASRRRAWDWLRVPVASPAWALAAAATLLLAVPAVVWQVASARGQRGEVGAWLSPGLVRDIEGELTRVTLPPECQLVRLRLDPGLSEHPSYRATLHEVAGDELWAQDKLRAVPVDGRTAVTLTLPCDLLPPEDYYVRLAGVSPGAEPEPLGRYDFRVLRP